MPTDLDAVSARKRAEQAAQTEISMLLFWLIVCLGMLKILFEVISQ
jgi:hypothetical protein